MIETVQFRSNWMWWYIVFNSVKCGDVVIVLDCSGIVTSYQLTNRNICVAIPFQTVKYLHENVVK